MKLKRILLLAVSAALLLAGCSAPTPSAFSTGDADALLAAGLFDEGMAQVDASIVAMLYGIDEATITSCVSYQTTNTSVSADELTILVLKDEAATQAAVAACEKRVDSQLEICRSYAPQAVPRLEGAVVRQLGNSVLLAVGDPDQLPAAVDGLEHQ